MSLKINEIDVLELMIKVIMRLQVLMVLMYWYWANGKFSFMQSRNGKFSYMQCFSII